MPVYTEPTASQTQFNGIVYFRAQAIKNVFAVVYFKPSPIQVFDTAASVEFTYYHDHFDTPVCNINFLYNIAFYQIPASVNFRKTGNFEFSAAVTFTTNYNLNSTITFIQKDHLNLLASIYFWYFNKLDFHATTNFPTNLDLDTTVNFVQQDNLTLPAHVTFQTYIDKIDFEAIVTFPPYYNINANTTFIQKDKLTLPASVYLWFANQKDFNAEITFLTYSNISAIVNFIQQATLNLSANTIFNPHKDFQAFVNLQYSHDTLANINFFQKNDVILIAYVKFFQLLDFHAEVFFPSNYNFPSTAQFTGADEFNLYADITFIKVFDTLSNVTFYTNNKFSFPAYIFLGSFLNNISCDVNFVQTSTQNFEAIIQIFQVVSQKGGPFNSATDKLASVTFYQLAKTDLHATTIFHYPPFDTSANISFNQFGQTNLNAIAIFYKSKQTEIQATVYFNNKPVDIVAHVTIYQPSQLALPMNVFFTYPPFNITANVIFYKFGQTNFRSAITINNSNFGLSGIIIALQSLADSTIVYVTSDIMGYFEFINLSPGNYVVTPEYSKIIFSPPFTNVIITNTNITIYFNAIELTTLDTNTTLPVNPDINQPNGNPGTYSIEGYITLNITRNSTNLFTIAVNETIASSFRETLGDR